VPNRYDGDFPEDVSPGHWGGYDHMAGSSFAPATWMPVRQALTYLAGYALADTENGANYHLDKAGRQDLAETVSNLLYTIQACQGTDHDFDRLRGDELARVLGAAEDCHFDNQPDEGYRCGCPTCMALLDVQAALGLPDTQWIATRFTECRTRDACTGCPFETSPECQAGRKKVEEREVKK